MLLLVSVHVPFVEKKMIMEVIEFVLVVVTIGDIEATNTEAAEEVEREARVGQESRPEVGILPLGGGSQAAAKEEEMIDSESLSAQVEAGGNIH